jgi:hypothetical protein
VKKLLVARHMFSFEEDALLRQLVEQHGENDWKAIAQEMPNRSRRQCRERYRNYLAPELSNLPWSDAEDALLRDKVAEYGPKWAKISAFFKSRSDARIKNRWSSLCGRPGPLAVDGLPYMSHFPYLPHFLPLRRATSMPPWAMQAHRSPRLAPECRPRPRPRLPRITPPRPPSPPAFEIADLFWVLEEGINDPSFELVPKAERPNASFQNYGGSIW